MHPMVKQFLHVSITVPDIGEALEFYRDVLGFESVFQTDNQEADGKLLGFDSDVIGLKAHHVLAVGAPTEHATEINLVEYTDPPTVAGERPCRQMNQVGITRLALLVENVDQAHERLKSYPGVEIVCEPTDIAINTPEVTATARWFSFTDPFGIFVTMNQLPEKD